MELFIYPFLLGDMERYVLWFTDGVDGVLTHENGRIATFPTTEAARRFAQNRTLPVSLQISSPVDLRWIAQYSLTSDNLDCIKTLDAWNFFVDVAASLPGKADLFNALDKRPHTTYEKVFWGNNLPAVTPSGEYFEPIWSEAEIAEIKAVLESGLQLFKANIDLQRSDA